MLDKQIHEGDEYIIYEDTDGVVTLIMLCRGITMLFSPDEWRRFSVVLSVISWKPSDN